MLGFDNRAAIVGAAREVERRGLNQGSAGNISLRDGTTMLITPSGVPAGEMRPEQIACTNIQDVSNAFAGPLPPSSEWRFHLDILRARADVNAIVHTHSPYATALSILRREIPAVHYMIAAFGGPRISCVGYAPFGTSALAEIVVAGLGSGHGLLLGNHGALVTGGNLAKAIWRAAELESLAQLYYLSLLAGEPVILPDEEIYRTVERFETYGLRSAIND